MSRKDFRRACALVIAATLLLSSLATAFAQQPAPAPAPPPPPQAGPGEEDEVVRVRSNLVQADAVVLDGRGRQVTDLQASDFEIVEDGNARRPEYSQYVPADGGAPPPNAPDGRLAANEVRRSMVFVVANPVIEVKNNFFSDERPFDTQPSSVLLSTARGRLLVRA
jgi:hypothetical protein